MCSLTNREHPHSKQDKQIQFSLMLLHLKQGLFTSIKVGSKLEFNSDKCGQYDKGITENADNESKSFVSSLAAIDISALFDTASENLSN